MSKQFLYHPDDPNNICRIHNLTKKQIKKLKKRLNDEVDKVYPNTSTFSFDEMRKKIEDMKNKRTPFKVKFRRLLHRINKMCWYIRGVLWDRYNVIKIKTLPPTYTDHDNRLLHASFAIFCDLIEKSNFFKYTSFDYTSEIERLKNEKWDDEEERLKCLEEAYATHDKNQKLHREILYLHLWWTKRRPRQLKYMEDAPISSISFEDDDRFYKKETENLMRLAKIRGCLWD